MNNISSSLKNKLIELTKIKKKILLVVGEKSFKILDSNFSLKKVLAKGAEYKIVYKNNDLISKNDISNYSRGLDLFLPEIIIGLGGGSVIDLAKLLIYYNYLKFRSKFKFIAIPTTCGSGSESTNFAVIYDKGIKTSINSNLIATDKIIHDPKGLKFLPKKALWSSISDSFCQSIESLWSINANRLSKNHAVKSIKLIVQSLQNPETPNFKNLLEASYHSGCAINISKTTGPHSFSYFLSSEHSVPHGLAVLFTMKEFLKINLKDNKTNSIFYEELEGVYKDINQISLMLDLILEKSNFNFNLNKNSFKNCHKHINHERLSNNPVKISPKNYEEIYINSLKWYDKQNY